MKAMEGGTASRRRQPHLWKAAGLALLGLTSAWPGCQWAGDHPTSGTPGDPPAAASRAGYRPQIASASVETRSGTAATPEPAPPAVELQQVAATLPSESAPPESAPAGQAIAAAPESADSPDSARDSNPVSELIWASSRSAPNSAKLPEVLPPVPPENAAAPANEDAPRKERAKSGEKDQAYQVDRTLPSPAAGIATPVIPPPSKSLPITLGASLALAGVANPVIGMADQAIQTALGEQMQARILLVPNINVGADFHNHDGPVQASFGGIRKVTRNVVNYGLGVNTLAAESIKIPGLFINTPLTDVIFAPLVARQVVSNRRFAATATRNQVLLEVATGYLALLGSEGRLAVIRQSEKDFDEVVRLTTNYLKAGAGNKADADRAQADSLALRYDEQQAQEEVAVASSELAHLLNLDPSTRLNTADVPIQIVMFIDPKMPLEKLLDIALNNRPELMAAAAAVRASQTRVRQEKTRIFLPSLWAGFSADDFGGGAVASTNGNVPNPHGSPSPGGAPSAETGGQTVPKFGRITGRTDVDVIAFWTLRNGGFGNYALIRQRRAQLGVAEAERVRVLNMVAEEVAEAYGRSAAQFQSIQIERRRVQELTDGFQRDLNLIQAGGAVRGGARPIEVLNQAKRLATARQRLLEALIAFDRAQFQLFVALGQPPTLAVDEKSPPPPAEGAMLPPAPVK